MICSSVAKLKYIPRSNDDTASASKTRAATPITNRCQRRTGAPVSEAAEGANLDVSVSSSLEDASEAGGGNAAPHRPQNWESARLSWPQAGQTLMDSAKYHHLV